MKAAPSAATVTAAATLMSGADYRESLRRLRPTVYVDGRRDAIFTGASARGRAVECALRRAEALRMSGPALVVVEPVGGGQDVSHVVQSQLAS